MSEPEDKPKEEGRRRYLYSVIFEAESFEGKAFDLALSVVILASILAISLESVAGVQNQYGSTLRTIEWVITFVFSVEYLLRLYCTDKPLRYARSFFGVIDVLSILPSFLGLFFTGTHSLGVVRGIRLLRVFRILKMGQFLGAANTLTAALKASGPKIVIFIGTVITLVIIIGSLMYLVEGPKHGFTSIPTSIYWAIVTLTTVGYGDIAPQTVPGQCIASFVMIIGYGIIAVPTGIVTSEMTKAQFRETSHFPDGGRGRCCKESERVNKEARYCSHCGLGLRPPLA